MAGFPRFRFLAIAMVFHFVYIFSIFDIYFVSPVVSGMRLFQIDRPAQAKAPADRLVLFVGDGLRADKAFQFHPEPYPESDDDLVPRPLAPFLRSRVLEHGTFGISHTRVPTESRPGHVALIAGLYEDVSAVTTGWKLNPVNFDSVFNRSRHTWSWGSPDILPMFEMGAVPGRVDTYMYEAEAEDFSTDATHLDYWVFDHVKALFAEAKTNATLNASLREDKVVFFLHLLGLDTTGHGFRPYSKEYLHNIKVVDQGVKEVSELINSFYNDDRTAFVFTADHGMSDWGSHGDGHPDNTRTPLVVWGSGVAKPVVQSEEEAEAGAKAGTMAPGHDEYSSEWGLSHVQRHDVAQADVAALMAYLVGVEFPANSVGELPLDYASAPLDEKARAALVNARGILEMYRVKEEQKSASQLHFRPYQPLSTSEKSSDRRVAEIEQLIETGNFEEAIEEAAALLKLGLAGLRYLQTYDWLFLRALITVGYLGWMAYALTTVVDLHVLDDTTRPLPSRTLGTDIVSSSVLLAMYASFFASRSPPSYYAYAFFPVFFWKCVFGRRASLAAACNKLVNSLGKRGAAASPSSSSSSSSSSRSGRVVSLVFKAALYIAVMESLALGYIYREIFTMLFILGAFWPVTYGISFLRKHFTLFAFWFISCLSMSSFTLLPANKSENIGLIMLGGAVMVAIGIIYLVFEEAIISDFAATSKSVSKAAVTNATAVAKDPISRALLGAQVGLILLSMLVTRSSALAIRNKTGLPRGNQIVGLMTLFSSFTVMPLAHRSRPSSNYLNRLMVVFLTFAPTFVILTISYEGLFYVAFSAVLVAWVRMEHAVYVHTQGQRPDEAEPPQTQAQTQAQPAPPAPKLSKKKAGKANGGSNGGSNGKSTNGAAPTPKPGASMPAAAAAASTNAASPRSLTLADARVALFFFVLLQSAFFSASNVASVSSFSLDSVQRLIPVFDPFSQGALLIVKLLVPFALISANLGMLNVRLGVAPSALFMVVMAMSDVLTLYFFWVVKDEGSWLEIGSTISHFVIASLLCAFVAGLEGVSALFVSGVEA